MHRLTCKTLFEGVRTNSKLSITRVWARLRSMRPAARSVATASVFAALVAGGTGISMPAWSSGMVAGFGDSITRGYPYSIDEPDGRRAGGYVGYLDRTLAAVNTEETWTAHNWGFGGQTSVNATATINQVFANMSPQWVTVMIGTNDLFYGISANSTVANIDFVLRRIEVRGAIPVLATILPSTYPGQNGQLIPQVFNPRIRALASARGTRLNDAYNVFAPNWNNLQFDGLHPNLAGYSLLATTWCNSLPVCLGDDLDPSTPWIDMLLLD